MDLMEIMKAGGGITFVILTLIQVAPVEIRPWSWLARVIGRALNADLRDAIDENNAIIARYRIIRFDDEIRHDVRHTEEHFNQINEDIDTYERYCTDHPKFPNKKAESSIENVTKIYNKCKDEHTFL